MIDIRKVNSMQRVLDMKMLNDYSTIKAQLAQNSMNLKRMNELSEKWSFETEGSCKHVIGLELAHILDSLKCVKLSCDSFHYSKDGTGNSFIQYTSFYREILSAIRIVMSRINDLYKKQIRNDDILKGMYSDLQDFVWKENIWRNKVEHDIDPFYSGDYEQIVKKFSINKIIVFMERAIALIDCLEEQKKILRQQPFIFRIMVKCL